jgi:hypothetical protein
MATSTIKKDRYREFVRQTYQSVINVQTSDTAFTVSATKSGYVPISYSLRHGYSSQIIGGVEQCEMSDGKFMISGFARSLTGSTFSNTAFIADVWWLKNF